MLHSGADSRRCSQTRLETRNRKWSQSTYHVSENICSPPQLKLHHSSSVTHCDITKKNKLSSLCGLLTAVTTSCADAACVASPPRVVGGANLTTFLVSTIIPTEMTQLEDALGHVHRSASSDPIQRRVWMKENNMQNYQTNKPATVVVLLEWKWKDAKNSTEPYFAQLVMSVLNLFFWLSKKYNWIEKSLPVARGVVI